MSMKVPWGDLLENYGFKTVSETDKKKTAYLPSSEQRAALAAAGIEPEAGLPFKVSILLDPDVSHVSASYYFSARSEEARRRPEPRMGREFISSWAEEGDVLVIGNIGKRLFAAKEGQGEVSPQLIGQILAKAKGADQSAPDGP